MEENRLEHRNGCRNSHRLNLKLLCAPGLSKAERLQFLKTLHIYTDLDIGPDTDYDNQDNMGMNFGPDMDCYSTDKVNHELDFRPDMDNEKYECCEKEFRPILGNAFARGKCVRRRS